MDGVTTGFPTLDAGIYEANFTSYRFDKIKTGDNAGRDMAIAEFTIVTDPNGLAVSNRKTWRNFPLLDNTLWVLKTFLVNLGMPEESISGTEFDVPPALESVLGSPCKLRISVGEYNGKPNNRVEDVLPAGPIVGDVVPKKAARAAF